MDPVLCELADEILPDFDACTKQEVQK